MAKPVNGHHESALDVDHVPVAEPDAALSDEALSDLPDARLEEEGRAPSAQALGVNHRAPAVRCGSRQVFRRMRQAWWIVVMPDGSPDDRADVAYSDNTVVVGDTSLVNTDR